MIYFTFGVVTYNQEEYILETLESIKYQIQEYGKNMRFKLIISDDCSIDNTVFISKMWTDQNSCYFDDIKIMTSNKNQGTVRNRQKMLDEIDTKYYKSIAGDDLFSNQNLFSHLKLLNEYDIVSYFPVLLNNNLIFYDKNRLIRMQYNKNRDRNYYCKEIKKGSLFHTPSTFYLEELYNFEVKSFVNDFKYFEDDPRWYMFIKLNKDIKIKFMIEPLIIYRMHDQSISHISKNPKSKQFMDEVKKLRKKYYEDEKSPLIKVYLIMQMLSDKIKFEYLKPINYIRKCDLIFKKVLMMFNKNNKLEKKMIEKYLDDLNVYYSKIQKKAKMYNEDWS